MVLFHVFGELRGHSKSTCMKTSLYRRGYGEGLNASIPLLSAKYGTGQHLQASTLYSDFIQ
jgi:hypothetical protein